MLVFFSRWWQLEALYRSNVKYQPEWEPRFLCFEDNRELPRVGFASAIAEGFVVLPRFGRSRARTPSSTPEPTQRCPPHSSTAEGLHADGSAAGLSASHRRRPDRDDPSRSASGMNKLADLAEQGIDRLPGRVSADATP